MNSHRLTLLVAFLTSIVIATGCNSTGRVADRYQDAIKTGAESSKTTVLFLIDGLATSTLRDALSEGRLEHTSRYFRISKQAPAFSVARASFPSLTFPNIASILTGRPVSQHGINGNRVINADGSEMNFENFRNWDSLKERLRTQTVFHALSEKGEPSISYSYPFSVATTAYQSRTIEAGVSYAEGNFDEIDRLTLSSLHRLLSSTPEKQWPRFIFVHLIGVDGYIHHNGLKQKQINDYIELLDKRLEPVYELLRQAESGGRKIESVLTADHGFMNTTRTVPLASVVKRLKYNVKLVADNRLASLYLPAEWSEKSRRNASRALLMVPGVEWTVLKLADRIDLYRANGDRARIELAPVDCPGGSRGARFIWIKPAPAPGPEPAFQCTLAYDQTSSLTNGNYMISSLIEYFASSAAPDLLVLPDSKSDFVGGYRANHGGLTPEEIFVPLLTRGVQLPVGIKGTWQILRDLSVF